MKPAFSSPREAAGFALLLAGLLALPALLAGIDWGSRRELYASVPNTYGPYPWTGQKIFSDTGEVDIAILGSSHLWYGLDTPYVQQQLSRRLNRPATVFTLGWNWAGYDMLYVVARDLLNQRPVRTLVIHDEYAKRDINNFHRSFRYWHRVGEVPEMVEGLPFTAKLRLYGIAVTGMPRQLLNLLRPNRAPRSAAESVNMRDSDRALWHMSDLAEQLGSGCCNGYMAGDGVIIDSPSFELKGNARSADVLVLKDETRAELVFPDAVVPPYQLHFAHKLARLCREHGTKIVFLHLPTFKEREQTSIAERKPLIEALGAPVIAIPGARLFAGIPAADQQKLFVDPTHLNNNGRRLFTATITPALLELYANPE